MANPSSFENLISNYGPVQTSILNNLTRWEYRNLQLAGVRLPVSREFLKTHQIPTRCHEQNPENLDEQCANTTETFDEIRACEGHPLRLLRPEELHQPCIHMPAWLLNSYDPAEPNIDRHPIHTKVCRRCRDFNADELLPMQLQTIAQFRMPLCERHSRKEAGQLPHNECRCLSFINDKWRCRSCSESTMLFLASGATNNRSSLDDRRISWTHPRAYFRNRRNPEIMRCPIEGCVRPAWLDANGMQLCMGCCAIIRT